MLASNLPTPGVLSNSQRLRHEAAHAISRVEINAQQSGEGSAETLATFFTACAAACVTAVEATQPLTAESTALFVADAGTAGADVDYVFTATIKNTEGDPIYNVPVTVVRTGTATGGVETALTGVTNGAGQFVVTFNGDTAVAGTVIYTATATKNGESAVVADTLTLS